MGGIRLLLGLALALVLACEGAISDPEWTPPEDTEFTEAEVDFTCGDRDPTDLPLRRLSRTQLQNTIDDVLGSLLGGGAGAVQAELVDRIGALPDDLRATDSEQQEGQLAFFRADQSVGNAAVEAHYRLSLAIGEALITPERLSSAEACLASALDVGEDGACLDAFVRRLGLLTHRRPLDDTEFQFFRNEVYQGGNAVTSEDLRDLVAVMFAQPNFLFHVEGTGELTGYELASRLSYQLWDSMPDDALFAAAESGSILTNEGWETEVERVLNDPRAERSMRSFLWEWFRFDHINTASSGNGADFEAVAGHLGLDSGFDQAVEDELVDLFMHVLRTGGTFEDFFLAEGTMTTHPVLADIYGVEPASPGEMRALGPERRGLLTRVGLLLSRAEVALPTVNSITHPILRGVFIRRQITCDNLPAAPGGAMDDLPSVDRTMVGSREATEILTSPLACSQCHGNINPTGYALEAFDAIGQLRTDEPLFDSDGNETMRLPINDEVTVFESDDPVRGGEELSQVLYDSEKVAACFARHYVRFSLGRTERVVEDGCLLRTMDEAIDDGRPLAEVITSVLLDPDFQTRAEN